MRIFRGVNNSCERHTTGFGIFMDFFGIIFNFLEFFGGNFWVLLHTSVRDFSQNYLPSFFSCRNLKPRDSTLVYTRGTRAIHQQAEISSISRELVWILVCCIENCPYIAKSVRCLDKQANKLLAETVKRLRNFLKLLRVCEMFVYFIFTSVWFGLLSFFFFLLSGVYRAWEKNVFFLPISQVQQSSAW